MRSLVIGTAGHIDHGKSALVKALTGTDPDRLKEEQERGITIDLGFAHLNLGELQVAFVDVPGHERFVRNMLAGAGGIDAVLLVVAADESVMPQTREHFEICCLLGIERGVVVITKSDLVDADTTDLVALEVRELTANSFLANAEILPVSARTGAGLDALRLALANLAGVPLRQGRPGVVRLPVDRVFSVKGFGTVVTGTLVSGCVREGDELVVLPDGRPVRVRGLQVHGRPVARADAPRRLALNLGAIDVAELSRGVTLSTPRALAVTRRIDARLSLLGDARPLRHGSRVRVHHGTDELLGRVAVAAIREPNAEWRRIETGERAVSIPPGAEAFVRLRLERPAVLTRGDRAVIRAFSPAGTIGGSLVLDPEPLKGGVRRAATFDRFQDLDIHLGRPSGGPQDERFAEVWLRDAGLGGMTAADLVRRGGLDPEGAAHLIDNLRASGKVFDVSGRVFDAAAVSAAEVRIAAELARFHDAQPAATGMPRETLRDVAAPGAPPELFEAIVRSLVVRGAVAGTDRLALPARGTTIDAGTMRARDAVERILREAGFTPPDPAALQAAVGVAPATLDHIVRLLVRERHAVRVGTLLFHADVLARLLNDVKAMKAAPGQSAAELDVATFKDRYGLTRKFAIPLLEWLDRERVTRRVGEKRIVL